jgi:adenosylhomocysteine nucleosidase
MDAPLTLACALEVEEKAALRGGAFAVRVGLRASRADLPDGRIAGFGLAGALVDGLEPGTLLSASRIVDESGAILWEGEPLSVPGARAAVLCAAFDVVDDAGERRALAERTGAVAVDMESGALAATGRLAGVVRAVSDSPSKRVGCLASASKDDGSTDWGAVAKAFVTEPITATRAARDARRALAALETAAGSLRGSPE